MNNAKMWLVVKPTVGVPLFLAGVAIGSFAVHVAVLTNTPWVSDFLTGTEMQTVSIEVPQATTSSALVEFKGSGALSQEAVVTLPDGRMATVVFDSKVPPKVTTAAVADPPKTVR